MIPHYSSYHSGALNGHSVNLVDLTKPSTNVVVARSFPDSDILLIRRLVSEFYVSHPERDTTFPLKAKRSLTNPTKLLKAFQIFTKLRLFFTRLCLTLLSAVYSAISYKSLFAKNIRIRPNFHSNTMQRKIKRMSLNSLSMVSLPLM